ncbi:hypothetical protein ACVIU7_006638 [Bradyrhizobium liaoningense]
MKDCHGRSKRSPVTSVRHVPPRTETAFRWRARFHAFAALKASTMTAATASGIDSKDM